MASSSMSISDLHTNSHLNRSPESSIPKKRRKISTEIQHKTNTTQWKSVHEQQIYSTKLVEALRRVRRNSNSPDRSQATHRAVRDTADQVLAVTAKGRTRWSRAIMAASLRFRKHKKVKTLAKVTGDILSKKPVIKKKSPLLQRKVRVLGRLVPGCRKLSFPNLLDETTDYIAALEMQVRAMAAISQLLNGSVAGSVAAPSVGLNSNL